MAGNKIGLGVGGISIPDSEQRPLLKKITEDDFRIAYRRRNLIFFPEDARSIIGERIEVFVDASL